MLRSYATMLRPHQWIKNLLLFFPPFFGGHIASSDIIANIAPAFFSFCAVASSSYILNDIVDRKADRNHEKKRKRPIAFGDISVTSASFCAFMLFTAGLAASFLLTPVFSLYIIIYFILSLSYTFIFKNIVILDIFVISLGFLVRVIAGGEAFGVEVSDWLFMSVFLVAFFLATGKRVGELVSLGDEAGKHRKSLADYTPSFLDGALWFSASAALVTYALYTIEQKSGLFYTVPLATFGLLRYIYIVKKGKGDPTEALLTDAQILVTGILWAFIIGIIIYG